TRIKVYRHGINAHAKPDQRPPRIVVVSPRIVEPMRRQRLLLCIAGETQRRERPRAHPVWPCQRNVDRAVLSAITNSHLLPFPNPLGMNGLGLLLRPYWR